MIKNLANKKLYNSAQAIADYCQGITAELPDDEKYPLQYTLKTNSFELTDFVAQAYGSNDPRDAIYKFGNARRCLYALHNALLQVNKQNYSQLNPDIMVLIEQSINDTETALETAKDNIKSYLGVFDSETYTNKRRSAA